MDRRIKVYLATLFIILSIFSILPINIAVPSDPGNEDVLQGRFSNSRARSPQIESSKNRGGSWVDEFLDSTGIATSTNIEVYQSDVILSGANSSSLTSNVIATPSPGYYWDSFAINKTEPSNTFINVSILDASNDQSITGFEKIRTDGEVDISTINSSLYPTLKLSATMVSLTGITPRLHFWGVSWVAENVWRDTFFEGQKLSSTGYKLYPNDGRVRFLKDYSGWDLVYESHSGFTSGTTTYITIDPHAYAGPTDNGDGTWDIQISIRIDTDLINLGTDFSATMDFYRGTVNSVNGDGISKVDQNTIMFSKQLMFGASRDYYIYMTVEDTAAAYFNCTHPTDEDINTYLVNTVAHAGAAPFEFWFTLADMLICSQAKAENGPFYFLKDSLITKPITLPENSYWGTLMVNKTEYAGSKINLTVLDASTNNPISGYETRTASELDLFNIDPKKYPSIKLQTNFKSDGLSTAVLHDLSLNWTTNRFPKILNFDPAENSVLRTDTVQVDIYTFDREDESTNLSLTLSYRSPINPAWQTTYFSNLRYISGANKWRADFSPESDAELGLYSLKVNIQDKSNGDIDFEYIDIIEVLNNKPTQPELEILPASPTTRDDLQINVYNVTDVEGETVVYDYAWYNNNDLQSDLTTDLVPSDRTFKNEVWKCIVTPNDGNEDGTPAEIEVTILNTPPRIIKSLDQITIHEDIPDSTSLNLFDLFEDPDLDVMLFSTKGDNYVEITIFNSNGSVIIDAFQNWHGEELVTFTADDGESKTNKSIKIIVLPENDKPELKKIGDKFIDDLAPGEDLEFTIKEGEWFNASITAEDIDGDLMTFLTNLTDNIGDDDLDNFYLRDNELSFLPANDDVGTLFVNLTMSDGNGSGEVYYNFKIVVLNTNNPPQVEITVPITGKTFKETDQVTFKCEVYDPDYEVDSYYERLSFVWYTNISGEPLASSSLGTNLTEITVKLKPGRQTISVFVIDKAGGEGVAEVKIVVTPIEDEEKDFFAQYWWLLLLFIIIIIILLVIAVLVIRKRRDEKFNKLLAEEDRLPRLQPELGAGPGAAGPYTQPQLALPVPATHPYAAARAAAAEVPQLPPRSDGVSRDEMVQLLELRLAKGEIDLETYKKLSRKYEEGPRYGVTPQQQKLLPPAPPTATPVTTPQPQQPSTTPTPTPSVQQPTVAPQPTQTSTPTPSIQQLKVTPVSASPTLTPTVKKADEENK